MESSDDWVFISYQPMLKSLSAEKKLAYPGLCFKSMQIKFINAPILEALLVWEKRWRAFLDDFHNLQKSWKSFQLATCFCLIPFFSCSDIFSICIRFFIAVESKSKLISGQWKWKIILNFSASIKNSLLACHFTFFECNKIYRDKCRRQH